MKSKLLSFWLRNYRKHIPFLDAKQFLHERPISALLISGICRKGLIDKATGLNWLDRLSPYISEEEYSMTKLLLEERS